MLITYYLSALVILGVWYALYRLWERRLTEDIAAGAEVEYDRLGRTDPALLEGLDRKRFETIYRRVELPLAPSHTFIAVAVFLLGAPIILAITTLSIRFLERTGVIPQPAEQAQQLKLSADGIRLIQRADLTALELILQGWGGFFTFFALLLFWVVVFYALMKRAHSRRAGSLREEVLRSR
jgi:hypothetical protein